MGFQEGSGRAPKVGGVPQLGPREPSGKLIRSIGALFGGPGFAKRSQRLISKVNRRIFDDSILCSERFLEGPESVLEAWGGAKAAPKGANKYLSANYGSPKRRSWRFVE